MIDIVVNNQQLVIDEITIDFDMVSPITRDAQGSTVFDFEIPDDPEKINARALNFPGRPNQYLEDLPLLETRIEKNGLTLMEGEAKVFYSKGRYRISLPVGNGLFYSKAKIKSIREIPIVNKKFETVAELVSDLNNASQLSWPQTPYSAVPIDSGNLIPEDIEGTIHFSDFEIDQDESLEEGDVVQSNTIEYGSASAELVSINYNDVTGIGSMVVKACKRTFFATKNVYNVDKGFNAIITSVDGWFADNFVINKYVNDSFVESRDGNSAYLTPFFYVAEILKSIFEYYGYSIDNRFFNRNAEWKSLLLFNNWNAAGGVEEFQNWPVIGINSSNHLPDYKVTDFLKHLENFRNIFCFINERRKEVTIMDLNEIIQDTEILSLNNTAFIQELNPISFEGFLFKMNIDSNREWYTDEFDQEYLNKIKPKVRLKSDLPPFPSYNEIRYVSDEDEWYIYSYHRPVPLEPRVLEWHVRPDGLGLNYYYFILDGATNRETDFAPTLILDENPRIDIAADKWDDLGLTVFFQIDNSPPKGHFSLNNVSLLAKGDDGIGKQILIPESKWMQKRKVIQFTATLSHEEMNKMQLWKKHVVDGVVFIITKLEGQIQSSGNIKAKITGWTI